MKNDKLENSLSINESETNYKAEIVSESEKSNKTEDIIKSYVKDDQKYYKVLKYANNCEEHNQISLIIPLSRTTGKKILFIVLNIFTVGLINLFIAWFPKLNLYLRYSVTDLENATHFGIFSKEDKDFEIVKKK